MNDKNWIKQYSITKLVVSWYFYKLLGINKFIEMSPRSSLGSCQLSVVTNHQATTKKVTIEGWKLNCANLLLQNFNLFIINK